MNINKKIALLGDIVLLPFLKDARNYELQKLRDDFFAAFSVALLAIPQSCAYSLLAGLPPTAGLFAAIFGAIATAAMGSSKHMVAGPTTGVAILLQVAISQTLFAYYPDAAGAAKEALAIEILLQITFLVGILQITAGLFNLGRILQFVSRPVILGYFAGVVIAIIVNQLYYFTGSTYLQPADLLLLKAGFLIRHLPELSYATTLIGLFSVALLLVLRKISRLPNALLMLIVAGLVTFFWNRHMDAMPVPVLGSLDLPETFSLKVFLPTLHLEMLWQVFLFALAIALLSILEVFSVSRGLSAKSGQKVVVNQEIFAIGFANLLLSFFKGAMPASGSVSRSGLNWQLKARTRFSAIFSGVLVAAMVFIFWPFLKLVPLCSLAAILIVLVPTLVDFPDIRLCFRASFGDGLVFLLTMGACLFFRLDIAFFIGIAISIMTFLKRSAAPHFVEYAFNTMGHLTIVSAKKEARRKIRIIGIGGELFFGVVELFQNALQKVAEDPHVRVIVLRFTGVYHIDASICFALLRLHEFLRATKRHLIISGITEEVWEVFRKTGLLKQFDPENLFFSDESRPQLSTWRGCMRAEELLNPQLSDKH